MSAVFTRPAAASSRPDDPVTACAGAFGGGGLGAEVAVSTAASAEREVVVTLNRSAGAASRGFDLAGAFGGGGLEAEWEPA